jgi:type IV secretory pathway VirB3-like protein
MTPSARATLFLAITRPTMRWGVPWEGFKINLFASMISSMILGNPFYALLSFPVVHLTMRAKASQDHNFFREYALAWKTSSKAAGRSENGGSTLEPIPSKAPRTPVGMISSV